MGHSNIRASCADYENELRDWVSLGLFSNGEKKIVLTYEILLKWCDKFGIKLCNGNQSKC